MLEEYIFKGTEKLRCGYTTGSCAAAAAKASAEMLLMGNVVSLSKILTPKGILLELPVVEPVIKENYASCGIIKDSGDDPDITDGILICAKASRISKGITITGGKGVGIITKHGLDQPIGEFAINSTPRKMIFEAVSQVCSTLDYSGGIKIEIFVPKGEEIALKTYNPRMGIVGGISIIGTSGIVEPMSNSAVIGTIKAQTKMLREEGSNTLLITLGNYGESFINDKMPFSVKKSVKCSNFIGEAIEAGLEFGFKNILIIGHVGKMVKLGAGIMNTHSAQADGRIEVMTLCALLGGANIETLKKIPGCATVDATFDIIAKNQILDNVLNILGKRIEYYLNAKVKNQVKIGAVIFSFKHDFIIKTSEADTLIDMLREEENG